MKNLFGLVLIGLLSLSSCKSTQMCPTYDGVQREDRESRKFTSWVWADYKTCKPTKKQMKKYKDGAIDLQKGVAAILSNIAAMQSSIVDQVKENQEYIKNFYG